MTLRVCEWTGGPEPWDRFVRASGDGTIMHLHAWRDILREAYSHPVWLLAAEESGTLRGVLPLALVRSPVFGRSLVSMPFMDYGGVCAGPAAESERPLVEEASRLAAELRAKLVLRYLREPDLELPRSLDKVTMWLELGTSEESLWRGLPSERRNRIRKAQRSGLQASVCGSEGLEEFYAVFARNMRDLGSPVHSARFFEAVLRHLPGSTRVLLVRDAGSPVGAGILLLHEGMISIPWVSSLRSAFAKCPNQLLYWEAMRFGIANGFRVLDLGRSSRNSGNFEAKRQWGARPVQLHWAYHPDDAEPPGEEVRRAAWAVGIWQRLPLGLVNRVGPWLRRGIAN
jgi:FemAB-related protein (PEP-CTERM system-associated)